MKRWWWLALLLLLSGCKVELYSGLNEQEANEMLAALSASGIDASKERQEGADWQVLVEESRVGASLGVLRSQGLPEDRYTSMGEVFKKQGLVSTPSEERMRYIFAVSQELSQTLRKLDGVIDARVHVVIPANDPLSDKIRPSSAAVFIKHRPDTDLTLLVPAVKDMVAHSIEGLTHDQVSLTLVEARRLPALSPAVLPLPAAAADTGEHHAAGWPGRTVTVLAVLLLLGAVALAVLPGLLRKRGRDWASLVRQVLHTKG